MAIFFNNVFGNYNDLIIPKRFGFTSYPEEYEGEIEVPYRLGHEGYQLWNGKEWVSLKAQYE